MNDWKQLDEEKLHAMLDGYLVARDKYNKNKGIPNRYILKDEYRTFIDELFHRLPDNYRFRGFVFHKAMIGATATIQIYTDESFEKVQDHLRKQKHGNL